MPIKSLCVIDIVLHGQLFIAMIALSREGSTKGVEAEFFFFVKRKLGHGGNKKREKKKKEEEAEVVVEEKQCT